MLIVLIERNIGYCAASASLTVLDPAFESFSRDVRRLYA